MGHEVGGAVRRWEPPWGGEDDIGGGVAAEIRGGWGRGVAAGGGWRLSPQTLLGLSFLSLPGNANCQQSPGRGWEMTLTFSMGCGLQRIG